MVTKTVWTYEKEKLDGSVGFPTSNQAHNIFTLLTKLSCLFNVKCAVYITRYRWGLEHTNTEWDPVPYFCEHHKRETIYYTLRVT